MEKTQELFNTVKDHLLKQNKRCSNERSCRYLEGELKCAVGCLIKPEFYNVDIEGSDVDCFSVQEAVNRSLGRDLTGSEVKMLRSMQFIHDKTPVEDWEEKLNGYEKNNF